MHGHTLRSIIFYLPRTSKKRFLVNSAVLVSLFIHTVDGMLWLSLCIMISQIIFGLFGLLCAFNSWALVSVSLEFVCVCVYLRWGKWVNFHFKWNIMRLKRIYSLVSCGDIGRSRSYIIKVSKDKQRHTQRLFGQHKIVSSGKLPFFWLKNSNSTNQSIR